MRNSIIVTRRGKLDFPESPLFRPSPAAPVALANRITHSPSGQGAISRGGGWSAGPAALIARIPPINRALGAPSRAARRAEASGNLAGIRQVFERDYPVCSGSRAAQAPRAGEPSWERQTGRAADSRNDSGDGYRCAERGRAPPRCLFGSNKRLIRG